MDTKIPKFAGAASDGARFCKISRRGGDRVVDRGLREGRLDGGGLLDDGGGAGAVASKHEADFGGEIEISLTLTLSRRERGLRAKALGRMSLRCNWRLVGIQVLRNWLIPD